MQYAISYIQGPGNAMGCPVGTRDYYTGYGWSREVDMAKLYPRPADAFRGLSKLNAGDTLANRPNQFTVRVVRSAPGITVRLPSERLGDHFIGRLSKDKLCAVVKPAKALRFDSEEEAVRAIRDFTSQHPRARWSGYIIENSGKVEDVTQEFAR